MDTSRTRVSDLPRGFQFPPSSFDIPAADGARYSRAVEDGGKGVPPLAAAAFALRRLLESMELPAGSLHAAQEVEFLGRLEAGATLELRAEVAQRSERAGFAAVVIEFTLEGSGGPVLRGRSTVMAPLDPAR